MSFVSRPHRLLSDDSLLTETQRAIHRLSELNGTLVALQTFKNHTCQGKPIIIAASSCMFACNYLLKNYILWLFVRMIRFPELFRDILTCPFHLTLQHYNCCVRISYVLKMRPKDKSMFVLRENKNCQTCACWSTLSKIRQSASKVRSCSVMYPSFF